MCDGKRAWHSRNIFFCSSRVFVHCATIVWETVGIGICFQISCSIVNEMTAKGLASDDNRLIVLLHLKS